MTVAAATIARAQTGWSSAVLASGVSDVAKQISGHFGRVLSDAVRTASVQRSMLEQRAALMDSYAEAQLLAQSGESTPPTPAALREAHSLLAELPEWAMSPGVLVEPSGAIALEWDLGPDRFLVFAVKGTGIIEFSAILGLGNESWGTKNFSGALGKTEVSLLFDLMQMKA